MSLLRFWGSAVVLMAVACGGERGAAKPLTLAEVQALTDTFAPRVARAVGLPFKRPPVVAVRSRAQLKAYIARKLAKDLPPREIRGQELTYRMLGLIPDTLDLKRHFAALLAEQVAGFYDPDSVTLYVLEDADRTQTRLILAHELVHALQGQYAPLDTILEGEGDNDVRLAGQAVMEGQATLVSIGVLAPDQDLDEIPELLRASRGSVNQAAASLPVFNSSPRIVQETLTFPYFAGAAFVGWFRRTHPGQQPYGASLPRSTEQILVTNAYRIGDQPIRLSYRDSAGAIYQNDLGELEMRILASDLAGADSAQWDGPLGWGGDRYIVLPAGDQAALVWWTVWDTPAAARFYRLVLDRWSEKRQRPGRMFRADTATIGGHPGIRLVVAPDDWSGWHHLPSVAVSGH